MEFGKVSPVALEDVDFKLPKDHKDNAAILKSAKKEKTQVYVGCAKWGRKDWIGKIYPKGTKEGDFLELYARQFNSIELNSTFYQVPSEAQIKKWYEVTPDDFLFVPKFNDTITHVKRLKDTRVFADEFFRVMSGLKHKFGPVFLMPHPQMGAKHLETITNFIHELPQDLQLFLELRHPEWYIKENAEAIFSVMKNTGTGSVITDAAGRRDCVHMRLSKPEAFIRFVGNGLHATDYTRIDAWVERVAKWMDQGLQRLFFFMHQHEEVHSPELCRYLIEQLNKKCDLRLKVPQFVNSNNLFD